MAGGVTTVKIASKAYHMNSKHIFSILRPVLRIKTFATPVYIQLMYHINLFKAMHYIIMLLNKKQQEIPGTNSFQQRV